ncbi:MAG: cytochrome d ubiquinol oxidase subunit II [Spirochaetaceae bacterium]
MSHELLANLWYYLLVLVWSIYISQELFVTGVSMLSINYKVEDKSFKLINECVGTFWDGIQVWLIVAIGGLFATFPTAYGLTLQALYIPFYLLLVAIIFRGTSIELIYKSDDPLWRKALSKIWVISSFLLIFIEGVYLVNLFIGLPIKNQLMTENFLTIFSRATLLGGLLFTLTALSMGYTWIKLTLGKDFKTPSKKSILWISGAMVFVCTLLFLSLTNEHIVFESGLFAELPVLWILPISAMLLFLLQFIFHLFEKYVVVFITTILGISLVLFTGFSASFPYILPSNIDPSEGIKIIDAAASVHALEIITIVAAIFLPVVIGYQTWKYVKFGRKF